RELRRDSSLLQTLQAHLRSYAAAVAYPPHQVFLGSLYPDELHHQAKPWFQVQEGGERRGPHGEIMPEEEFYGWLKICDLFDLLWLEEEFSRQVGHRLKEHPYITQTDLERLGAGLPYSRIEAAVQGEGQARPLYLAGGRLIGCMHRAHEEDPTLEAGVLLENLACKATATMALRTLLGEEGIDPHTIGYVLNSGEEAVGDRYQRGGGNLAKAIAEMSGCLGASGVDIKGFCCGPLHALTIAGSLVRAQVFPQVAVVAGCSLAKLGMKFRGHLQHDQPVLEDVLAGMAVLVGEDDGYSPVIRFDSLGHHPVQAGSSQQAIYERLVAEPLQRLQMRFCDIDKYATELHNPEITEPAGSGNVPLLNYRVIGGLAALRQEITPADLPRFVERHGMPGFAPTQGHIASAVPFLGHAVDRMRQGKMERVFFLAKGSLFLGRMTQMADGCSFMLERNRGVG
ncbi:MAG: glycine reductase, partial [Nitrospinota bacterium]